MFYWGGSRGLALIASGLQKGGGRKFMMILDTLSSPFLAIISMDRIDCRVRSLRKCDC